MVEGKFSNPFKTGKIYISQTYHSGSNNKYAVDFGSKPAGSPVYAVANGVISNTNTGGGSYCTLNIDDSELNLFYVHTYNWSPKGTKVSKGQKICEIAPSSINGGYPAHLHLGIEGTAKLMDYFDRSLNFATNYSDIAKDWFIDGKLNWSLFKDLSYLSNAMKIGDRVEVLADTNMRFGSGTSYKIAYTVKEGSVGRVIDGPRTANDYEWWDIIFLQCDNVSKYASGWMANVGGNRFKVTTEESTCVNGTTPEAPVEPPEVVDCTEYTERIKDLEKEIEILEEEIKEVNREKEILEIKNEDLEGIIRNYQIALAEITGYK